MFPKSLAEGLFSLRAGNSSSSNGKPPAGTASTQGDVCCAISMCVTLADDGSLDTWQVVPSLLRVSHRLTYEEADADIALGPGACQHQVLQQLYEAARAR